MSCGYLEHHGVHGMKWGIKKYRYKNPFYKPIYKENDSRPSYGRTKNFITDDGVRYNRSPNIDKEPEIDKKNIKYLSQIGMEIFKKLAKSNSRVKIKDLDKRINSK